jgi:hypothetical protein
MLKIKDFIEFKYNKSNGGINYLLINFKNKLYSTDYFYFNGGHRKCIEIKTLKEFKKIEKDYIHRGYKEYEIK